MSQDSNKTDLRLDVDTLVEHLKSVAEPSRLRMLKLLAQTDLTVSELTTILGQSQPRVSRHLKLLLEARLIRRRQEGSWALFRLDSQGNHGALVGEILSHVDAADPVLMRDAERLDMVKRHRRESASSYFSANAQSWDQIRSLHVADGKVEAKLLETLGKGPFNAALDIGTGTGRMLELLAPRCRSMTGIDSNRDMLNVARANMEAAGIAHADLLLGDVFALPVPRDSFDLVVIHQVLHFLDDPERAVAEAARSLSAGGRLVIVDFAPHDLEFLREKHRHHRLGFDTATVGEWFRACGLEDMQAVELAPGGSGDKLTVMIWVARDPRLMMADDQPGASGRKAVA